MELFGCFFVLVIALGIGWIAAGVGIWVFRPIERAGKSRRLPPQYSIPDFLCLFVLVQVPMAFIHYYFPVGGNGRMDGSQGYPWILDIFAWFSVGMLWWGCVQALSRAGIYRVRSRATCLVLVLPTALAGVLGIPVLLVASISTIFDPQTRWTALAALVGLAVIVILVFVSGLYTRRLVAQRVPVDDQPASDSELETKDEGKTAS